jgi:hypothetical protein
VFAPTDQAFEQLPEGALDELMKDENRAQLTRLLEHHVVEGQAIAADDLLGQQSQFDTMSGDSLTIDGSTQVVLLVPTGLTIARVGEQMVIEREGGAVSTRAISVQDQVVTRAGAGEQQGQAQAQGQQQAHGQMQGQQGQQAAASTPTAQGSDMPMTEHQQQALESQPAQGQRQTAAEGSAEMPATEHQQQALQTQPGQGHGQAQGQQQAQQQGQGQAQRQGQQAAASTPTAQGSDMPMTEHQQQALESQPAQEQRQTAAGGATDMPASEHQRQLLAEDELPGEQQQYHEDAAVQGEPDLLREASVVGADIQADNGVIHVIDAVLLPQDVLKMLEEEAKEGQG